MATAVLRLRITGSPGAYTVSAEVGDEQESDTLGALPDKLRETLQPLQEAILLTTESLRNRALRPQIDQKACHDRHEHEGRRPRFSCSPPSSGS